MAYGGNITATVTIDISKAQAALKTITAEANNMGKASNAGGTGINNLQKSVNSSTAGMSKYLNEIQKVNTSLPGMTGYIKGLTTEIGSMSSAMSKVTPGNFAAMGKEVLNMGNGFQRLLPAVNNFWKDLDKATQTTKNLASNMQRMPLETYWTQAKNAQQLNKSVQEASSSTAALGRAYVPMTTAAQSFGQRASQAFTQVRSKIGDLTMGMNSFASSFVSFDIWMAGLVGGAFLQFTVGAAMSVDSAIQLMHFIGMTSGEVDKLSASVKQYAASSAWVSQPEMLNAWRLIRMDAKLTGEEMSSNNSTLGDTIALFKANGRSAEDAGRAIDDAMSGQFMRFREINVKQSDLIKAGWDGNKNNAMGFFAALQKVYKDRGIAGFAMSTAAVGAQWENVKEKIQLVGVAIGQQLLPYVSSLLQIMNKLLSNNAAAAIAGWGITAVAVGFVFALLSKQLMSMANGVQGAIKGYRGLATAEELANVGSMRFGNTMAGVKTTVANAISGMISGLQGLNRATIIATLTNPWFLLVAAIAAAAAALIYFGNKYGWFRSATENANIALDGWKKKVEEAKNEVVKSQGEIDKWTAIVAKATPGTVAYKVASDNLAQAKRRLALASQEATHQEDLYNKAQEKHKTITNSYTKSVDEMRKNLLLYKVAIGEITPRQAELAIDTGEYADSLSTADGQLKWYNNDITTFTQQMQTASQNADKNDPFKKFHSSLWTLTADFKAAQDPWTRMLVLLQGFGMIGDIFTDLADRFNYSTQIFTSDAVKSTANFWLTIGKWVDDYKTRVDKANKELGRIWAHAKDLMQPIFDAWNEVVKASQDAYNQLLPSWIEIKDAFAELWAAFGEVGAALSPIWTSLVDAWNEIKTELVPVWDELKRSYKEIMDALFPPAPPTKQPGGELKAPKTDDWQLFKDVVRSVADILIAVAGAIKYITPILKSFAHFISTTVVPAVKSLAEFIRTTVVPAVKSLAHFISTTVIPAVKILADTVIKATYPFWAMWHIITGNSPGIIPALKELWSTAQTVWNNMVLLIRPVLDPLQKIWDILVKISQFKPSLNLGSLLPKIEMPKFNMPNLGSLHLPTPEQILGLIRDKLKIFGNINLSQLFWSGYNWIQDRLKIFGNINLSQLFWSGYNWIRDRLKIFGNMNISQLFWNGYNWVRDRINNITGRFSLSNLATQAFDWVKQRIPAFHWPWGPAGPSPSGPAVGVGGRANSLPIPHNSSMRRGAIAGMLRYTPGVGGLINAASSADFSGLSGFSPIADALASRLRYKLYLGNPKSDAQVMASHETNCMDGAELLINEASTFMKGRGGIGKTIMPQGWWGGWPHRWAVIGGKEFDMAGKLVRRSWAAVNEGRRRVLSLVGRSTGSTGHLDPANNPIVRGPAGPSLRDQFGYFMDDIGPTLEYMGYAGHGKNPVDALFSGGNCFDMTLGVMGLASELFGLPSKMTWGTYGGNSHVWANIGGNNYDLSRRALEGTYNPPPQGPGPYSSGYNGATYLRGPNAAGHGITIQLYGDIYGFNDFKDKCEDALNEILNHSM